MDTAFRSLIGRDRGAALGSAVGAGLLTAAIALLGTRKIGTAGLLAPLAVAAAVLLMQRPRLMLAAVTGLVIACEGPTFGLPVTPDLIKQVYKGLTPLDILVGLLMVSVLIELMRDRRRPIWPPVIALPSCLVLLAMVCGAAVGHAAGEGLRSVLLSEHVLAYLLVIPFAVLNLRLDERHLDWAIQLLVGAAVLKAVAGLVAMEAGITTTVQSTGSDITSSSSITYYEPTANWLILVAALGVLIARYRGLRVHRGLLAGWVLLVASLVLSYRRSFWIAGALDVGLVLLLASTLRKRVVLLSGVMLLAAAIVLLGSVHFQAQTPLVERLQSLNPTSIQTNAEDRYRLDERTNVIAEIKREPLAGLGMNVPWSAAAAPLGIEHVNGRLYVHFALLWWWLKLGILGAVAYASLLIVMARLAWRAWRRAATPWQRCFGLASACAVGGLIAIETTASFTGVDDRFTALFAVQLGLLAAITTRGASDRRAILSADPVSAARRRSPSPSRREIAPR